MSLGKHSGFSLIEILVTMSIVILLSAVGLRTYQTFTIQSRDTERQVAMNNFVKKLETYKNDFGVYPCGDACAPVGGATYSYDCSDVAGAITGNDPEEVNGFLNGGDCCSGTPTPTTTPSAPLGCPGGNCDDSIWGLYRNGYLDAPNPKDPLNVSIGGTPYRYCYATPAAGRKTFALFSQMEQTTNLPANDAGFCALLYDIVGPQYTGGWVPGTCNPPFCGDTIISSGETCDPPGAVGGSNGKICRANCTVCGDGIVQAGEACDDGVNNGCDLCTNNCARYVALCATNGICEPCENPAICADCGGGNPPD